MKHLAILIMLFAVALPLTAQESTEAIKMGDFDRTYSGFSFSAGGLVELDHSVEDFPMEIDFIFDRPVVLV